MTRLLTLILGLVIVGLVFGGIIWLLWWLFVVAAVVTVAGTVWRAVTQR